MLRAGAVLRPNMDIEVTEDGPLAVRLTLDEREVYLLKVALERASYLDTQPEDVAPALNFAEVLLRQLNPLMGPRSDGDDTAG